MSQIAQDGYLALAVQTAKGTQATVDGTNALLITSSSLSGQSELLDTEAEIGGSRQKSASAVVMGGFTVSGELEGLFRPKAFGLLLLAAGFAAPVPVQDAATGAFTHTFTPGAAKYLTIMVRWGTGTVRRFTDCLVDELTISLDANGKVTWSASIIGRREEFGIAGVTPTFETSPVADYAGSAITLDGLGTYRWESIELGIANNLSDDEFVIGSRQLEDVTPGELAITLSGTVKVGDNVPALTDLYRAAVLGSKTATDSATAGATPYHTSAAVTFGSAKFIGTSVTKRFGMVATIPDLVMAGFPLEASGADRLTVEIEAEAFKAAGNIITLDLQNDRSTQYV